MLERQGFPVHPDRHHRVAAVEGRRHGEAATPPVETGAEDLLGLGLDARLLQQTAKQYTTPHCVADVGATHLVGDAADGDDLLHLGQGKQVVISEGELAVDHAVNGEGPRRRVGAGERQGGVDAVEPVVGCEERGAGVEVRALGH